MAGKADYYADGQWNFYCDFCGAKNKSLDSMKTWSNYRVCQHHKEVRNPQDFVRGVKDNQSVPWTRPRVPDVFVGNACYLWDQSAYAGLGTAGCMQAGYAPITSQILFAMKFPGDPGNNPDAQASAIPGWMIPGLAIPSTVF